MKVFVAGAGGAIGRPLVPRLVAAGHEVTGTTRSDERAAAIRAAGATAAVVDCLDADALRQAVEWAAPDVVLHQLTALPGRLDLSRADVFDATNRLRGEGTTNLLGAARAAGARRFVCQSIAVAYAAGREPKVLDEDAPLALDAPPPFGAVVRMIDQMERAVVGAHGLEGLVLRYGWFYGPGTYCADDGSLASDVREQRFPVIGSGADLRSFIHVDDAAAATVIAVERGAPGIYNVVDDEPAAMRDWVPAYAEALGARPPRRVGDEMAAIVSAQPGASNAKAKRELGWEPRWRSWRDGFRDAPR
jgi:nucleoside-diphosphate-sugar epimerase